MVVFAQLPPDILDQVLLALPNFNTLAAALRSSKCFLDCFNAHPASIVKTIAFSTVGPALPQAYRLVHCLNNSDYEVGETLLNEVPLTRGACVSLENHSRTVHKLENLFSLRYKDRRSPTSKLTAEESLRFRRALYRIWLYNAVMHDIEDESMEDSEMKNWTSTELRLLPESELFDLHRVFGSLIEVESWGWTAANDWQDTPFVLDPLEHDMDPEQILLAYEESMDDTQDALLDVTLGAQLEGIWCVRNISDTKRDTETSKAILNSVDGHDDACNRCHAVKGIHLWGRSNAHLLRGFIPYLALAKMMDGNLWKNSSEMVSFKAEIHDRNSDDLLTFDWTLFLEEILAMDEGTDGPLNLNEWYCHDCVLSLLRSRLRKWWIARKVANGTQFLQDCWYGYNCRTQVHRRAHAEKLNHLCEPTRGDKA